MSVSKTLKECERLKNQEDGENTMPKRHWSCKITIDFNRKTVKTIGERHVCYFFFLKKLRNKKMLKNRLFTSQFNKVWERRETAQIQC